MSACFRHELVATMEMRPQAITTERACGRQTNAVSVGVSILQSRRSVAAMASDGKAVARGRGAPSRPGGSDRCGLAPPAAQFRMRVMQDREDPGAFPGIKIFVVRVGIVGLQHSG